MSVRKIPLIMIAVMALNLLTILTAPVTLEPGTVRDLDANANMIDNTDRWEGMNPYAKAIYLLGDLNCHQMEHRSFIINGNQMPVCARCTGLALGFFLGAIVLAFAMPSQNFFRMFNSMFLGKKAVSLKGVRSAGITVAILLLFCMPMIADGTLQLFTNYESNNTMRAITGLFFGIAFTAAYGIYLESFIFKAMKLAGEING